MSRKKHHDASVSDEFDLSEQAISEAPDSDGVPEEMPTEKSEELKIGTPLPKNGKKWAGQKHVTTRTAADVVDERSLQAKYAHPNAVTLDGYFTRKGVRDPVKRAAMMAYTKVRRATVAAFDEIFAKF